MARDATSISNPVAVGLVGSGDGVNNPNTNQAPSVATVVGDVMAYLAPAGPSPGSAAAFTLDVSGGEVTVKATSDATADGELHGGSGAVGLTVTILEADSTQSLYTDAFIGDDVDLLAQGVDVEAWTSTQNATTNVVVGAGSIVASGGSATGNATIAGGTLANIGTDFNLSNANLQLVNWGDGSECADFGQQLDHRRPRQQ